MTTVKGFFKSIRYITQIFDEEKDRDMQIGLPTDVKHVAHIGSDSPSINVPSWMGDFKPQENENSQVIPQRDNNIGVGSQESLPPPEKPKHKKTRRKSESASQIGSPPRRNSSASISEIQQKHSRRHHHRSRHGSIDSSNDPSVSRRRRVGSVTDMEGSCPLSDSSSVHRRESSTSSRHRKSKGSGGGGGGGGEEISMKKTKEKTENHIVQSVDKCNDNSNDKD